MCQRNPVQVAVLLPAEDRAAVAAGARGWRCQHRCRRAARRKQPAAIWALVAASAHARVIVVPDSCTRPTSLQQACSLRVWLRACWLDYAALMACCNLQSAFLKRTAFLSDAACAIAVAKQALCPEQARLPGSLAEGPSVGEGALERNVMECLRYRHHIMST